MIRGVNAGPSGKKSNLGIYLIGVVGHAFHGTLTLLALTISPGCTAYSRDAMILRGSGNVRVISFLLHVHEFPLDCLTVILDVLDYCLEIFSLPFIQPAGGLGSNVFNDGIVGGVLKAL